MLNGTAPVRKRRATFWLLLLLLLLLAIEGLSAVATRILERRGWMASVPSFEPGDIERYFAGRDPHLGWSPTPVRGGSALRLRPARGDPVFPDSAPACGSAYGDSFTNGTEAGPASTYAHQLGLALGCRVANYGWGGFGSDQALMLFRAQRHLDRSRLVILGHTTENILRNVNQSRHFLYPGNALGFKPRFVLDNGSLRYVPPVIRAPGDFERLVRNPEAMLALDAFVSRPRRSFPYSIALGRWLASDYHVRARLAGVPRHAAFYSAAHPSGALALTTEILATFDREARAEGRQPVVLLIPLGRDLRYARETGRWTDQPLADGLRSRGVPVVHAGPAMLARLRGEDPCSLFHDCSAHFNDRGYLLLAQVLIDELRRARPALFRPRPGP
jgi:hypothetical protein